MVDHGYVHELKAGKPGQPIFFVFHGTGGDENQFFTFASELLPDATIVSPRGDVSNLAPHASSSAPARVSTIWPTWLAPPKR